VALMRDERQLAALELLAEEQAALRRIATLVAEGATKAELGAAVTLEIGLLFGAQRANTMRWDGDTIRIIGSWSTDTGPMETAGRVYPLGGDTINTASSAPASRPASTPQPTCRPISRGSAGPSSACRRRSARRFSSTVRFGAS
jgi:hypothetical protein